MRKGELYVVVGLALLMMAGCLFYGIKFGFGAQCTKAGYTGAAHERCVDRRVNGGPVYEENIGRMTDKSH